MKSSCERRAATMWNQRPTSFCPSHSSNASAPVILSAASDSASTSAFELPPSAEITISSGTTARSWNSSTPMMLRPCSVSSSRRSASIFVTMAVDDMASAPPSATDACHENDQNRLTSAPSPTATSNVPMT